MPSIIFNYKICDKAPECGGISECPHGAITFDPVQKRPVWNRDKCTFCLKCTLPDACPVGAILYAANDYQEKTIQETLAADPRSEDWLWQERYGVSPSATDPLAVILSNLNFDTFTNSDHIKLIDVWHPDFVDCRLHSPLFSQLTQNVSRSVVIGKLNGLDYPELTAKLHVSTYPSLLIYQGPKLLHLISGYIKDSDIAKINRLLLDL